MSNQLPSQHNEEQTTDLLAMLAAARELDPDMDSALAESYLQKHPIRASSQAAAQTRPRNGTHLIIPQFAGVVALLGIVAAVVVAMVASGGHTFWLFWLPFALAFWWRPWRPYGRWGRYYGYRAAYRSDEQTPRDDAA